MHPEIYLIIKIIRKELWQRWKLSLFLFTITALAFLTAAWSWPKIYTSSSVVLVDQQSILSPLMRGTAVTTELRSRVKLARQIILSQRAMQQVIASDVWAGTDTEQLSAVEYDQLKNTIRNKVDVLDLGQNLIEISFKDTDAHKAYETASLLTDIFIKESVYTKQQESGNAFQFIDEQVNIYQNKLMQAEKAIKEFRAVNVDASQVAKNNVTTRLVELQRELEAVDLEISSESSSILSNKKRLSGEVRTADGTDLVRESELQLRINALNQRLDELRLNYKDTYPDIIQLKGQINTLKKEQIKDNNTRVELTKEGIQNAPSGAIAQELRRNILMSEAKVQSLIAKGRQIKLLIERERKSLAKINAVEAEVAELNRDYNVNQEMYQDLLQQREQARISMNMDIKNQGLTMKIQEPATLPIIPEGIRFLHIILAGLAMSFIIPIGLVYLFTLLDQKVRNESYLRDVLRLPILSAVYNTKNTFDYSQIAAKYGVISATMLAIWFIYGYVIFLRIQG